MPWCSGYSDWSPLEGRYVQRPAAVGRGKGRGFTKPPLKRRRRR